MTSSPSTPPAPLNGHAREYPAGTELINLRRKAGYGDGLSGSAEDFEHLLGWNPGQLFSVELGKESFPPSGMRDIARVLKVTENGKELLALRRALNAPSKTWLEYQCKEGNAGFILRGLRESKNISLKTLSERTGFATATISKWENDKNPPLSCALYPIRDALELNTTQFNYLLHARLPDIAPGALDKVDANMKGARLFHAYWQLSGMTLHDLSEIMGIGEGLGVRIVRGKQALRGEALEKAIRAFSEAPFAKEWFSEDKLREYAGQWDEKKHFVTIPPEAYEAGNLLWQAREAIKPHISQTELACLITEAGYRLPNGTLSKWETKGTLIAAEAMPYLIKVFGMSPDEALVFRNTRFPALKREWRYKLLPNDQAGLALFSLRELKNISREQFCTMVGITLGASKEIEIGDNEISLRLMPKIKACLNSNPKNPLTSEEWHNLLEARFQGLDKAWLSMQKPHLQSGLLLRAFRGAANIEMPDLAKRLGIENQEMSYMEIGASQIPAKMISKIARIFSGINADLPKADRWFDENHFNAICKLSRDASARRDLLARNCAITSVDLGATLPSAKHRSIMMPVGKGKSPGC